MYMKKELFLILDIAMLNKNLIQISNKIPRKKRSKTPV